MARENQRIDLAHLLAVRKLREDWEAYERWGKVDYWLVTLWVVLLVGSFGLVIWWYFFPLTVAVYPTH